MVYWYYAQSRILAGGIKARRIPQAHVLIWQSREIGLINTHSVHYPAAKNKSNDCRQFERIR